MNKIDQTLAWFVSKTRSKQKNNEIKSKLNSAKDFNGVTSYTVNKVETGATVASYIKPATTVIKKADEIIQTVNKPIQVALNKVVSGAVDYANPSTRVAENFKGRPIEGKIASGLSKPAAKFVTEKSINIVTGIGSLPSTGIAPQVGLTWWAVSKAANVSGVLADNKKHIHSANRSLNKFDSVISYASKITNKAIDIQEQEERELQFKNVNLNQKEEKVTINSLNSEIDGDVEAVLLSFNEEENPEVNIPGAWKEDSYEKKIKLNTDPDNELFGKNEEEKSLVLEFTHVEKELKKYTAEDKKLTEELKSIPVDAKEEFEKYEDKEELESASVDVEKELKKYTAEEYAELVDLEKSEDWLKPKQNDVLQITKDTFKELKEDSNTGWAKRQAIINTAGAYVGNTVPAVLEFCGAEKLAAQVEEITASEENFKRSLDEFENYLAPLRRNKIVRKVKNWAERSVRQEEIEFVNNTPYLHSVNHLLNSTLDTDVEAVLLSHNEKPNILSSAMQILGLSSNNSSGELFGEEEIKNEEERESENWEKFEEIPENSVEYYELKTDDQEDLTYKLAEAMEVEEDSEDNEVFYDALEEQENNKEEVPAIAQQKTLIEVKDKSWFYPFSWPIKIK